MLETSMYFSESGPESYEDWKARGPYYHFNLPSDGSSADTRLTVTGQFSTTTSPNAASFSNARVLVADHYDSVVQVSIQNGRVINVINQEL